MQKKREGWSIVLAGFWNRMIFTPEWVGPRLFGENPEIETVVALLPILPIIYRDNQVAVEISSARIVCRARNLEDEAALRRSGTTAGIVLDALPETPVQGVGVNFAFREEAPPGELLDLFGFADNPRWVEAGWEMGERKIVRQLTHDGDTLNLGFTLNGGQLDIDCNFHTVPDNNAGAVSAVEPNRVIQLRDLVTRSLGELYGLELEADDDEA
jgi:hypothetical protein